MDIGGVMIVALYFIYPVLSDIRNTMIATRIQNYPTFINVGWIKYRRLLDGSIETIESAGYKKYKSENEFNKKNSRSLN